MMIDSVDVANYAYSWSAHTFVCSEYSERAAFLSGETLGDQRARWERRAEAIAG